MPPKNGFREGKGGHFQKLHRSNGRSEWLYSSHFQQERVRLCKVGKCRSLLRYMCERGIQQFQFDFEEV